MKHPLHLFCALALLSGLAVAAPHYVPAEQRLQQLEAALSEAPSAWGAPVGDRKLWERVAKEIPARELLEAAAGMLAQKPEEIPDELYLRYSRDGNRDEFQQANVRRLQRLNLLAWAEAIEGKGRFADALRRQVELVLAERTWVLPAHDGNLNNYEGRWQEIDLMVAMKGWTLATILHWHRSTFGPELTDRIRAELRRRVIAPFFARMNDDKSADTDGMWWNQADNNWNSVCHAGVVGTALATLESRIERARVVGWAELNLEFYLKGFTPDGYCSEGVGYWNYGFGHFAMLSETLRRATNGVSVPLAGDHALRVAAYPWGLRILPGVFPAFADMDVKERPSTWFGALAVMQVYPKPLGMKSWGLSVNDLRQQMIYESSMKVFLPLLTAGLPAAPAPKVSGNHNWFPDAQVYTGRAAADFGAAIKGGHNNEHHNHNDLGSFVVARGGHAVLVDPGLEVYTQRTFSADRYMSKVINSYGHSVPVVAGELQKFGRDYAAKVVFTSFSDQEDIVVLDLAGGYAVPALKSLVRTFTLRRGSKPEIVISDTVEFTEPSAFETALITFEKYREKHGTIWIGESDSTLRVQVNASAPWKLRSETIEENLPNKMKPARLGLAFEQPITRATLSVTIRPH